MAMSSVCHAGRGPWSPMTRVMVIGTRLACGSKVLDHSRCSWYGVRPQANPIPRATEEESAALPKAPSPTAEQRSIDLHHRALHVHDPARLQIEHAVGLRFDHRALDIHRGRRLHLDAGLALDRNLLVGFDLQVALA